MRRKLNRQTKEERFESVSLQLKERSLVDQIPAKKTTIAGFMTNSLTKRTKKNLSLTKIGRKYLTGKLTVEGPVITGLEPTGNAGESSYNLLKLTGDRISLTIFQFFFSKNLSKKQICLR